MDKTLIYQYESTPGLGELCRQIFRKDDRDTELFPSRRELLLKVRTGLRQPDVVITNTDGSPSWKLDALALLREVRKLSPDTILVVWTAIGPVAEEAKRQGFHHILKDPVSSNGIHLAAEIAELLEARERQSAAKG